MTFGQSHTYIDAILRAGGLPLLIPVITDIEMLRELYIKLDGILLAGGNDVSPKLYNAEVAADTGEVSDNRDLAESSILLWAIDDQKPILAICRGMQLMNVACGGTLHQHIPADVPSASNHAVSSEKKDIEFIAHDLKVAADSKLAGILESTSIKANSHHHQATHKVAPVLREVAWSEDGLIEALEGKDDNFFIGVQCHPESLGRVEPKWDKLFTAFVDASK